MLCGHSQNSQSNRTTVQLVAVGTKAFHGVMVGQCVTEQCSLCGCQMTVILQVSPTQRAPCTWRSPSVCLQRYTGQHTCPQRVDCKAGIGGVRRQTRERRFRSTFLCSLRKATATGWPSMMTVLFFIRCRRFTTG